MRIAIYPGTFDPVTNGHLDVLGRACKLFDKVIIAVANNSQKKPLFPLEKRLELIKENLATFPNAQAEVLEGLTVDFAQKKGAQVLIRGLRAISDFEYEFQIAQMNRHMASSIETIFLMPNQDYFYTTSTLIKAIAGISPERVGPFIPANVLKALQEQLK